MSDRVLLIGSGSREHAIALKLAESAQVGQVWVAPGNGGTQLSGNSRIRNLRESMRNKFSSQTRIFASCLRLSTVKLASECKTLVDMSLGQEIADETLSQFVSPLIFFLITTLVATHRRVDLKCEIPRLRRPNHTHRLLGRHQFPQPWQPRRVDRYKTIDRCRDKGEVILAHDNHAQTEKTNTSKLSIKFAVSATVSSNSDPDRFSGFVPSACPNLSFPHSKSFLNAKFFLPSLPL